MEKRELNDEDAPRYWAKIKKGAPDECWLWTGAVDPSGYGRAWVFRRAHAAHRVSFEIHHRALLAGELACHTCDTPACCNPAHLFAGTHQDNYNDMRQKGRERKSSGATHYSRTRPECLARGDANGARKHPDRLARGDRNGSRLYPERLAHGDKNWTRRFPERVPKGSARPKAKLTESQVAVIRSRYAAGGVSQQKLADELGVNQMLVSMIVRRKIWKHVP